MNVGNLVRPLRQPLIIGYEPIDLNTLGVIHEICGLVFKVRWPDNRILTFNTDDLEDLG